MIVMPPSEWPPKTTGPSGTTSSSTWPRSRPVRSIVASVSRVQLDRPWPRWSQSTTWARSRSASTCGSHSISRAVNPWVRTTVTGAASSPANSTCRRTPSSVRTVREPGGGGPGGAGRGREATRPFNPRAALPKPTGLLPEKAPGFFGQKPRGRSVGGVDRGGAAAGGGLADQPAGGVHLAGHRREHAVGQDLGVVGGAVQADVVLQLPDRPA